MLFSRSSEVRLAEARGVERIVRLDGRDRVPCALGVGPGEQYVPLRGLPNEVTNHRYTLLSFVPKAPPRAPGCALLRLLGDV